MAREGKLAKNTLILSLGTFLPKLVTFVILPILTGELTKDEYGTYDLVLVFALLLLPAVTLQIHTAAFRFILEVKDDRTKVKSIITSIFAVIIPVSVVVLVILYFCLARLEPSIRILVCVYLFVDILAVACQWVIRGLQKNAIYAISAILNSLGKMVLSIICVWWLHLGLHGALLSLIAANVITILVLLFLGKIISYCDLRQISAAEIRAMLAYSWPLVPNSLSMWVMRVSDRFVVTMFMGVAADAVYAAANKIPQILTVAQNTFSMAWQENASVSSKDDDAPLYYSSMFSKMYDLLAGSLGLLIAMTPILFKLLIRGDYGEAYFQIPILLLAMFFSTLTSYLGGIYVAFKATKSIGITTFLAAICNLVLDFGFIKLIGLYAASGSTLISYLFLCVYRMFDVRKLVDITYNFRRLAVVLSILIVECVLCFLQKPVLNFINVVFGVVVFFVLNRELIIILMRKAKKLIKKVF